MIKVVHITENPIAGAPIALSKALNKWQSDKVQSRHIAVSDRNENRIFDHDLLIGESHKAEIFKVIQDADIIHMHNFWQNQELFRKWPELWPVVMKKKRCWQAHTQREISWMSMEDGLRDKGAKHLVIAQYHPRLYPECQVVPNIVDIFDPRLAPSGSQVSQIPRVAYSPSRIGFKGWDNKGYHETVPVLQKLVNEGYITAEVIYNKPWSECLERRSKADISIDEIVTGSYHLCSLESLAQGKATIAGLDAIQVKTLRDLTGSDDLPWVIARPETLESAMRELVSSPPQLFELQQRSRQWMETYWHPKKMTDIFVKIYEGL